MIGTRSGGEFSEGQRGCTMSIIAGDTALQACWDSPISTDVADVKAGMQFAPLAFPKRLVKARWSVRS